MDAKKIGAERLLDETVACGNVDHASSSCSLRRGYGSYVCVHHESSYSCALEHYDSDVHLVGRGGEPRAKGSVQDDQAQTRSRGRLAHDD